MSKAGQRDGQTPMSAPHPENQGKTWRYERKFYLRDSGRAEVEAHVRLNPGLFREIHRSRWVNNIYLDSESLHRFRDSVAGLPVRDKVRIRWYGELFGHVGNPVLEIKKKRGLVGRKKSFALAPFTLDQTLDRAAVRELTKVSGLHHSTPALLNRYRRKYFLSSDGSFRITVDSEFEYFRLGPNNNSLDHRTFNDRDIVLELKYGVDREETAALITGGFPFRITSSSKYVRGVEETAL